MTITEAMDRLRSGPDSQALATVARKLAEQEGRIVDAEGCCREQASLIEELTAAPPHPHPLNLTP